MSEALAEIYDQYDKQELACQEALERRDRARTSIGRFVTGKILAYRQFQLAQLAEEAETGEFQAIDPAKQ